jgi:hypothetical protein
MVSQQIQLKRYSITNPQSSICGRKVAITSP